MTTEGSFEEFINSTFAEMTKNLLPGTMVTNFVVVAEIASPDSTNIAISVSENMTPWLADGMLRAAADMVASGKWEIRDNGDQGEV